MNVPHDTVIYLSEFTPSFLWPPMALILGIMHLFPPCCIASYVLAEVGQNLFEWLDLHSHAMTNWPLIFQQWESDYYDEERKMHLCRFHAKQGENIQYIPYEQRTRYQKWLGTHHYP